MTVTPHQLHHDQHHDQHLAHVEHKIEQNLKHSDKDFHPVFHELQGLKKHDTDPEQFKKDLLHINDKLHKDGFLQHMQIVDEGDGKLVIVAG